MKRIIDGKIYNTETAELLGDACSGGSRSDFRFWKEHLYRTRKGVFFLRGEGGAMSHWASPYPGGGSQWGEGIHVLTNEDAREWAEKHLDTEEYLAIFPAEEA